jgi:hypothetical protein
MKYKNIFRDSEMIYLLQAETDQAESEGDRFLTERLNDLDNEERETEKQAEREGKAELKAEMESQADADHRQSDRAVTKIKAEIKTDRENKRTLIIFSQSNKSRSNKFLISQKILS